MRAELSALKLQREQASAARISADAQLVRNELEQQCKELEKKLFDSEAARAASSSSMRAIRGCGGRLSSGHQTVS